VIFGAIGLILAAPLTAAIARISADLAPPCALPFTLTTCRRACFRAPPAPVTHMMTSRSSCNFSGKQPPAGLGYRRSQIALLRRMAEPAPQGVI
jgi:hypothetical protein